MKLLFKLAWRNIWRNRRRSIITMLAVAFAVTLTVVTRGLQLGTYEVNIQSVVRLYSGFLQIQRPGYQDNPSLRKSFPYTEEIRDILDRQPLISGYTPRVYADALISYKDNSYGTMLVGIDMKRERNISHLLKKIRRGRQPSSDRGNEIIIGERLLKNLNAQIGDSIIVLAQGFDGFLRDSFCKIVGTFRMGSNEFDRTVILMPIRALQELLGLENRVSVIAISLEKLDHLKPARESLQEALQPFRLCVLTWDEVMPSFKQSIELDNIGGILFLAILVIVVAFGILNTVLMSVTERFREFGIILALGMPQKKLVILVALEIFFLVLLGITAGNLLGGLVNWYLIHHPIEFSGEFAAIYEEYGFLPIMTSTLKLHIFLNTTLSVLAAAFVASLYPLRKVAKLEPLKGIRYT